MAETSIEWATHVWNPTTGCDRVLPGRALLRARPRGSPEAHGATQASERRPSRIEWAWLAVTLHEQTLTEPSRWRSARAVFVNSMSDLFYEEIPAEYIARVFEIMVEAKQHAFQVSTKREDRLAELAPDLPWPANVWMGVSIENRRFIHRADRIREVPASVRFISAEPLALLPPHRPPRRRRNRGAARDRARAARAKPARVQPRRSDPPRPHLLRPPRGRARRGPHRLTPAPGRDRSSRRRLPTHAHRRTTP
jgi:hypothetical protein